MKIEIKSHGNGKAVYRDGEWQSDHRTYREALASLSPSEQHEITEAAAKERAQLDRDTAMADRFGPDWDKPTLYPDCGLDANT